MRDLWGNELEVSVHGVFAKTKGVGCGREPLSMFAGLSAIPRTPCVYFLLSHDETMIKIGKARNPRTRIRDIRAMNPHPLTVAFTVRGYSRVETFFHQHLSRHRSHGEWFWYEGAVVDALAKLRSNDDMLRWMHAGRGDADILELGPGDVGADEQHHDDT